ncbi:MAG TPA: autotransporter-associated beta strand repeat-containing protein, partial [Verrucomicrobiae bacterium]|nr:autotransporter-associated beta strand repeat-containing protein [Verrucomicrobiae bacterium]
MKQHVPRFVPASWLLTLLLCSNSTSAQLPAFPGAQGFGRFATGGRGGSVYFVTNLNDSGPGSFRDAVSVSGRTVIFRVGGVIAYTGSRYNVAPNITVAGQTAPGDGVTLYGDGIGYNGSHNTITRFIRYRMGINGESDKDAIAIDTGRNMIFDHITASWGRDETFSISGSNPTNITIQSSIISQGLQGHSAGGLVQTDGGVSILRTLYIDNDTRNPKVKGVNEYVNNVICNWETIGYNMGGDSAGESFVNVFNNYFMRGPASSGSAISGGNTDFHIFATNNWYDGNRNGVLDGNDLPFASYGPMDLKTTPYPYPISYASAYSPLTALKLAISDAGPSFRRDSVDEQMISELISWGELGSTITSELIPPMDGPGIIRNGTPYPDTDNDGMPDFWEIGTGSNPGVANNNDPSPSGSGYTRLEDYLNWLAEPHGIALQNTNVVVDLRQFTRGWVVVNRSPFWSVSDPVNGTVALTDGYMALFTPTPGHNGRASFQFTVNDADGGPLTRTMNLFFTPSAQSYTPVWHGNDIDNTWNVLGAYHWHDDISLLYQFHQGDAVLFDDSGSAAPAVNLSGSLQPASVTINAAKNYAFSGSGSLDGAMSLHKTNTGTLTINNTNGFTGNTTVSNGTLLVHGALTGSAVTVRNTGIAGGNGLLGSSLIAVSGSTIVPGNGIASPGTLTIANALTLSGSVTNRFDISDDPTGTLKTNDIIRVLGNLNLSGVNVLKFSLLDGLPGNGVYTLFTYTGALNGSLANFALSGISGTLTNPPGQIAIIVNAVRPPGTLTWTGNGGNNFWDNGTTVAWNNEGVADRFYFGDDVIFNNTGATNLTANLVGELTPASVTVNATANYTLTGTGKITGTTGLTKTNSGTLTILTTNDFTGPTIIGGGTLSASRLAPGGAPSSIGAAPADSANLIFSNSRLSYTGGTVTSDRGATFNGSANFDITSAGTTLTWNGTNVGTSTLIKSGPGTLVLTAENSFNGGTIVSNGTLALFGPSGGASITANNYALGSGSVTLYGGTLKLFGGDLGDAGAGYGTFSRPIIVPAGATASLLTPARYTMNSSLSGGGTLNLEVNYVRGSLNGNWSAFTGTINVTAQTSPAEFRVTDSDGYAGATIFLNDNAVITQSGSGSIMDIGALGGTSGSRVGPGNQTSSGRSFRIGWNNRDATFAGQILADGVNTVTKVGTGNWTLTGANTYTGGTIVSGGTLTVNNTTGSGTGSGSVTVNNTATLAGTGIINGATTINSGATIAPGNAGPSTLTINNGVTLAAGSTTRIEINKTSGTKDLLDASGTINYGGTLIVTNLSGTLAEGDSFKIFDGNSYAGSFTSLNLPPLPPNLMWYPGPLTTSGTISVVSTNFTIPQPLTWAGDGVANVWDSSALNWLGTNGQPRAFANGDTVAFGNSGSTTPALNLTTSVAPAAMTVNASVNYTIAGTGALTGSMGLTKAGSGRLTLANTGLNTFTGGTTISAGSLQIGDGVSVNGNLPGNIINNATLIIANPNAQSWNSPFAGSGTLIKQAAGTLTVTSTNNSYGGNVIIAGGAITLGTGATLNTGSLTLSNGGTFNFPPSTPSYAYPGSIIVPANQSGTISSPGLANSLGGNLSSGNSSSVLNISSGVSFAATTTAQFDSFSGTIHVLPGGTLRFSPNSSGNTYGSLNPTFAVNGELRPRNAGNTVRLGKVSGNGTLSGPQSNGGSGNTTYQIGGSNVDSTFNGIIASNTAVASSLVVLHKVGTARLTLTSASTYTGGTIVSNGALFISNSTGSGTGSGNVRVRNGATLGGSGFISGATTVENGATLTPGNAIGTLTFGGALTLQSGATNVFELGTISDSVVVSGALTAAGRISIIASTGFGAGTYTLFTSSGGLTLGTLTLGTLPAGYNYALNTATPGQIKLVVTSIAPPNPPSFTNIIATSGNLILSGDGGTPTGSYYVLTATNVTLPSASWSRVATNQFDAAGRFNLTNPINPAVP